MSIKLTDLFQVENKKCPFPKMFNKLPLAFRQVGPNSQECSLNSGTAKR